MVERREQQLAAEQHDEPLGQLGRGFGQRAEVRGVRARDHAAAEHAQLDRDQRAHRGEVLGEDRERQHVRSQARASRRAERRQQREVVAAIRVIRAVRHREPGAREKIELARGPSRGEQVGARLRALALMPREHARDRVGGGDIVARADRLVERLPDHGERQEAVVLQLADRADARHERCVVPGHRSPGLAMRGDQAFAQVVLDRRDRDAGIARELADLEQARRRRWRRQHALDTSKF